MTENRAYLIAFGYAYGRMDAEDCPDNRVAAMFAEHWARLERAGLSRKSMPDVWVQFRADH